MLEVGEITIQEAHDGFKDGRFTAEELTSAFLKRIARWDKNGPRINSTMALSGTALEEAKALDDYFQEKRELKGKLHGIPVLVPDQATTKGIATTYGSAVAGHNVPDGDAFVVTKLKEAGAVILGKTTLSEWPTPGFSANGATASEFTKNPYNLDHGVRASSGGSGAAVTANFTILAVGEDTGGSIRVASSFCNIVGLRPTPGLISRTGFYSLIETQDTPGPMARTVTDCALMLDCMVGFDRRDGFMGLAEMVKGRLPQGGSYTAFLDRGVCMIKTARIGVIRQRFGPDSDPYCRAVNRVVWAAIDELRSERNTFIDVHIDDLDYHMNNLLTKLQRSRRDTTGPLISDPLMTKPYIPHAIADLPSTLYDIPDDLKKPSDGLIFREQRELKCEVNGLIESLGLDALILPDVQVPPPRFEDATNGRFMRDGEEYFPTNTSLATILHSPAISVPVGFTEDGLPVGMELIGRETQDQFLLELAYGIEKKIGKRRAPPAPL
ncbi:amidase signature enzyme [Daldinia caldariorum]|uniref:amidase signature enzyme n=1 Tax=Daldinia caldariorum TaxID=326644 RepID=UPI0020076B5D|nr:amidase signature enzyme [Daldinia caldariorum]KAI1469518.1 amidase signature enzyme [Daldinia caldariorum]